MKLIVDSRETSIIHLLNETDFKIEALPCGDFLFEDDHMRLLVERKTLGDLQSSIKDGRYREQRSRLLEWRNDTHKIMYLIEGDNTDNTIETILHRLMISHGIPVHRTKNIEETVKWLKWVETLSSKLFQTTTPLQDRVENIRFSKNMKKESILNQKTILISLIYSIHGVSYPMAAAIAEPFQSVEDFIRHKERLVSSEFMYETATRNKKKISPKIIAKVIGFVFDTPS